MSSKGNRTIVVLNGYEDYNTLKESIGEVFVETEFFCRGRLQILSLLLSLKGATSLLPTMLVCGVRSI